MFSAAALGISYLAAALAFRTAGVHWAGLVPPGEPAQLMAEPFRHGLNWMLVAAAAGLVQNVINTTLVLAAAKGADRTIRLRDAQFSWEPLYNDLAELCLAVLVAFGVASSPVALLFAFPFAALPLRASRHAQLVSDSRTDSKTGLLLPFTRAVDAFRVADRVRGRIAALPLSSPGGEAVRVTASVGVAALEGGSQRELTELMAAADAALYRAKRGGRNQVQMLSPTRGLSATSGLGEVFGTSPLGDLAHPTLPSQPGSPEMTSRSR